MAAHILLAEGAKGDNLVATLAIAGIRSGLHSSQQSWSFVKQMHPLLSVPYLALYRELLQYST